jgi:hypothetical protein
MKTSIKLIAIALLSSSSVFASVKSPVKSKTINRDSIYFNSLTNNEGVKLRVKKSEKSYTIVTIYDSKKNLIFTERFSNELLIERKYLLGDVGTYFFVIESPNQKTEKEVTVVYSAQQIVSVNN